jgi:hypothetical protein
VTPKVKCTPELMRVEIPIAPSTKRVYLDSLRDYPDPACRPHTDPTGTLAVLELDLRDVYRCAVTRVVNKQTVRTLFQLIDTPPPAPAFFQICMHGLFACCSSSSIEPASIRFSFSSIKTLVSPAVRTIILLYGLSSLKIELYLISGRNYYFANPADVLLEPRRSIH